MGVESYLSWTSVWTEAQVLYDRLTAIALRIDLLSEASKSPKNTLKKSLDVIRAEIAEAARSAQSLADEARSHVPRPGPCELQVILQETLAPLEPHLLRRETPLIVGEISGAARVAIEPAVLRAAIASAMEGLLRSARAGETLSISHFEGGGFDRLQFDLAIRGEAPEAPALLADLAPLKALLELRGGRLSIAHEPGGLQLTLHLPSARSAG